LWKFPPGIYPIGPPPVNRIKWPRGVKIDIVIPGPWPPVTIGFVVSQLFDPNKLERTN
jgi:hypothetical protein